MTRPFIKTNDQSKKDTYYDDLGSVVESHNFSFNFFIEASGTDHFSSRWNVFAVLCVASSHLPPVLLLMRTRVAHLFPCSAMESLYFDRRAEQQFLSKSKLLSALRCLQLANLDMKILLLLLLEIFAKILKIVFSHRKFDLFHTFFLIIRPEWNNR